MPAPTPSAYQGRDFNPAAIGVRLQYPSGRGMALTGSPDGGLTIDVVGKANEKLPVTDRGNFDGMNPGPYVVQTLAITVRQYNEDLVADDVARLEQFFAQEGYFAGETSASDVPGCFEVVITYADKSTKTFPICEGELAETHAFPSNTYGLTVRSHGGCVTANV